MLSVKFTKCKKSEKVEKNPEKHKKKRAFPIALAAVAIACAVLLIMVSLGRVPDKAYMEGFSYSLLAETESEREGFWKQFGFEAELVSKREIFIPESGEDFESYNRLQIEEGLDLRGYCGFFADEYVFSLSRADYGEALFGVMTVYKNRVVALHFDGFKAQGILGIADILK